MPTLSIVLTVWRSVSKIQKVLSGFEEKVAIGCIPSGTSDSVFLLGSCVVFLWNHSLQLDETQLWTFHYKCIIEYLEDAVAAS